MNSPQGFGQRYWVQVIHTDDTPDEWQPINGGRTTARDAAALAMQRPAVDFALVLCGRVPRGGCPKREQVLDEFNRVDDERAAECKVYRVRTKAAKQRLRA